MTSVSNYVSDCRLVVEVNTGNTKESRTGWCWCISVRGAGCRPDRTGTMRLKHDGNWLSSLLGYFARLRTKKGTGLEIFLSKKNRF